MNERAAECLVENQWKKRRCRLQRAFVKPFRGRRSLRPRAIKLSKPPSGDCTRGLVKLTNLFSPVRIGNMELPNRIVMAPMGVEIVEADGKIREPTVQYYVERARGGVGLIITENTAATYPRGANSAHEIAVSSDEYLPGLTRLAEGVHEAGAKIAIQLVHHGKVSRLDTQHGREMLMPSIPRKQRGFRGPLDLTNEELGLMAGAAGGGVPKIREATREDLTQLIEDFADAADRARRAGFDAVEIHGAHGYIFSEFLSPAWNFRDDEYGGSLENRARLLCEAIRAAKERTGGDFPIWCRIDAIEFGHSDGIDLESACATARLAEAAGADAINVSAYANPLGAGFTDGPIVHRAGGFLDFADRIKKTVTVPVITAGRISPELGDEAIRDGRTDLIAMGRQLLADPETVSKLEAGRPEQIRPCVYCYVCVAQPFFDRKVRCSVNPIAAQEAEYAERLRTRSESPKRVLVVGGGPAGLEAASVAAMRGHEVILVEKDEVLGGTLRFAALPYEPNENLLEWFEARVSELPIDIRTGVAANAELVRAVSPDVVIAAIGAVREKSKIPGAELDHVWDGDTLRDALSGRAGATEGGPKVSIAGRLAIAAGRATGITSSPSLLRRASRAYMPMGKRVVVVGGGLVGVELAEFFAERGREVTVLEEESVMAMEMAHPRRWRVLFELREAGVRLETNAHVESISQSTVRFSVASGSDEESRAEEIATDAVVIAGGLIANPEPIKELESAGVPIRVIGDAQGVGYIEGAIRDGFHAAIDL
jgi:2,4-dienoyl-CoA reductase-like NADH-dependent reductase (Old Yellow Enzyme family)/NADPH-dependent 2,4-dienoyl-CoA reductase/sulfur reductase-like enzyme